MVELRPSKIGMKRLALGLCLAGTVVVGCHSSSELPPGISPLAGLDPTLSTDDLEPFAAMIDGASAVGLGESVHTSGGYHQANYRLIRFLVESQGFRVITLETPRLDAEAATAYVATCAGTVGGALKSIFPVFASSTFQDLFAWACQYNQQHPGDPISFHGFDIQDPWSEGTALKSFFTKAAASDAAALSAALDTCDGVPFTSANDYRANPNAFTVSADAYMSCQSAVATTRAYLAAHNAELIAASSTDEVMLASMALRAIETWEDQIFFRSTDPARSLVARDQGMADTFMALRSLRFPTAKAILWAHDGHLMSHAQTAAGLFAEDGEMVMGTFLKEQLGDSYQAFALIGYQVDINWPGYAPTQCKELTPPTAPNAVENLLHALATPSLLIDLDFPGASTPFLDPALSYNLFDNDYDPPTVAMKPREQFRGLVYLDHSPAMQATQWSNCP